MDSISSFVKGLAKAIMAKAETAVNNLKAAAPKLPWDVRENVINIDLMVQRRDVENLEKVLESLMRRNGANAAWHIQYALGEEVNTSWCGVEDAMHPVKGRKAHIRESAVGGRYTYDVIIEEASTTVVYETDIKGYEAKRLVMEKFLGVPSWGLDYLWRCNPSWSQVASWAEKAGATSRIRNVSPNTKVHADSRNGFRMNLYM